MSIIWLTMICSLLFAAKVLLFSDCTKKRLKNNAHVRIVHLGKKGAINKNTTDLPSILTL